jgi:hypothetical protein
MFLVSILIAYTFISGVLKQYVVDGYTEFIQVVLAVLIILWTGIMMMNILFRFGQKYVNKGHKHRQELMNITMLYFPIAIIAIYFYSVNDLRGNVLLLVYILLGVVTLYDVLYYLFRTVVLEDDKMVTMGFPHHFGRTMKYEDIKTIQWSLLSNSLKISDGEQTIYLDVTLTDIKLILNTLTSKVDSTILKNAFEDLKKFYTKIYVKSNIEEMNYFKEITNE